MGEERPLGGSDEVIRAEALAIVFTISHPQVDGATAFEFSIMPLPELPATIGVARGDGIVGAAQRAIGTDAEIRAAGERGGVAVQGPEGQRNHVARSVARSRDAPKCALRFSWWHRVAHGMV